MITREQKEEAIKFCLKYIKRAKIIIIEKERKNIEVTDFGLGRLHKIGLQLIVYITQEKYVQKN